MPEVSEDDTIRDRWLVGYGMDDCRLISTFKTFDEALAEYNEVKDFGWYYHLYLAKIERQSDFHAEPLKEREAAGKE